MRRTKSASAFSGTLLAMLLCAFAPAAQAQGSRKDDVVFNSRGMPLAGATVRVCAMPATGQPCSPLALIYSDLALTQALPNPTTTDGLGNYSFYAAPGKYMIEISGPAITTRQIPNVILPSDPTAPAFSSLSSTGAITAFSLILTGNLTVNGNATVLGSLASGTLNLTNQGVAPGAPSTGTVNLYSKTDKRLYYKDDTGTEIGPVANTTGAQTNVTNTFTAAQNFDANTSYKGPNPWYDITRYGGIASIQTTTGNITTGTPTLTVAAAQDFANGQGIVVLGAGSATALSTPTAVTVAPQYIVNGATTYNYQVACEDYAGGITAASSAGSTSTGAATLGVQSTVNITSAVRTSGVVTVTTAANHNFSAGMPVNIAGTGNGNFNGVVIVTGTPTGTTFTFNQSTAPNETVTTGTVQGIAYNKVTWSSTNANTNTILRCWVYRNNALVGVEAGQDTYFEDYGFGLNLGSIPSSVPTAPGSAVPGYLATTITSGGGTTTLALAANAGTTVSGAAVLHDNAPALNAAAAAATGISRAGVVYVPNTGSSSPFQLNSAWRVTGGVKYILGGGLNVSQPIILASGTTLEGLPGSATIDSPAFGRNYYAQITCGTGSNGNLGQGVCPYPFFYAPPTKNNVVLRYVDIYATSPQLVGLLADAAPDGSGSTYIIFDNAYFSLGAADSGVIIKGGFGFYFNNTGFNSAGSAYGSPQMARFTTMNSGTGTNISGIVHFADCIFNGTGVQFDALPHAATNTGGQQFSFRNTLFEGGTSNFLRVNIQNNIFTANYFLQNVDYADPRGGSATPLIDVTNTTNLQGMDLATITTSNGSQPLVVGNPAGLTIRGAIPSSAGVGSTTYTVLSSNNFLDMHNIQIITTGAGMNVPVGPPSSTPSAVVSSGGSVPIGLWNYAVTKMDYSGKETVLGPASASALVTSGNQTVTVDCAETIGGNIQFLRVYRSNGGGYSLAHSAGSLTTCHYVDTFAFGDGNGAPSFNAAGDPAIDGNGVAAGKLRLNGELMQSAPRAEQNVFLPGALTATWTGSTWTLDKAITVTRVEAQAKTAPAGCTTIAVVRLTDGTSPVNVNITAAANSSGAISQNYAAGASVTIAVQTAAAGCTTNPADVNVTVQYRMQ